MSDLDRHADRQGAEAPLTMGDGPRGDRRRPRARGPMPVSLIVSVLLLFVVAGGAVFFMYRSGVRQPGDAPQPLGAPLGDVRAPAPPQTQTPDAAGGLTISKEDPNALQAAPTLAPPPEQPLPESQPATAQSAVPAPKPAVVATAAPPPHAPAAGSGAGTGEKTDVINNLLADSAKPAAPKPDAEAGGSVVVQIGAFSSPALADKEWSKAAAVAPGAMAGKGKRVVAVAKDGDTLYRTAITGFASRDQAQALCDRLIAAGGSCFVR